MCVIADHAVRVLKQVLCFVVAGLVAMLGRQELMQLGIQGAGGGIGGAGAAGVGIAHGQAPFSVAVIAQGHRREKQRGLSPDAPVAEVAVHPFVNHLACICPAKRLLDPDLIGCKNGTQQRQAQNQTEDQRQQAERVGAFHKHPPNLFL